MLTIQPLISRTLRRLGVNTHYAQHASKSWEFEPACESERFAAIFDETDLQKVTSVAQHTTLEFQLEQLRAGRYRHPARRVHLYRDAVMVNGHVFTMRMVHQMAHRPLPGISTHPLEEVARGALGTTGYGNKYFGHWFSDDVSMSATARQFADVYGHVNSDNRLIGHQNRYAELFEWKIRLVENVRFRELLIPDWSPMTPRQGERFANMRERLPFDPAASAHPGVMLLRHTSGQRRILDNESEVGDLARSRGFKVIDPMTSSVDELVAACANAKVVMGVEGSQLTHGFLPMVAPGGAFLTFQPPFKFDHFWKSRCDCIGARYAFVVGTQTADAGYTVDIDQVERVLDRLDHVRRVG